VISHVEKVLHINLRGDVGAPNITEENSKGEIESSKNWLVNNIQGLVHAIIESI